MFETSIWMIDESTYIYRNYRHNRNVVRKLAKAVRRSRLVDSRQRAEKSAEDIGTCLEPATGDTDLRGAYTVLKRWYRHASTSEKKTSWADMSKVTGD